MGHLTTVSGKSGDARTNIEAGTHNGAVVRAGTVKDVVRHYLRDLIYGAHDGIITTFAVVAGVTGGQLSTRVILVLGIANLLADGFSMAAGAFLSMRSEEAAQEGGTRAAGVENPLKHGLATFVAFVTAGVVPLVAYLVPLPSDERFPVSIVLTHVTLFVIGASRSYVTRLTWWLNGLEMLAVGAVAAIVAYVFGAGVAGIIG